jgi:hypothetical protein
MVEPIALFLWAIFTAIFFYILYGVARAAIRDGILQAYARIQESEDEADEINSSAMKG